MAISWGHSALDRLTRLISVVAPSTRGSACSGLGPGRRTSAPSVIGSDHDCILRREAIPMTDISRRDFVRAGALAGVAVGLAGERVLAQGPAIRSNSVRPVVIASGNGNQFKNGGDRTCIQEAFGLLVGGSDPLDALLAGVNIVERDPEGASVGYGGLPNADGIVQLDSCCMHGPKKRAGGVAALEGVRTPSLVARAVMEQTDHHLIVGKGAQDFARGLGFKIEDDLNTPNSRKKWLEWKRRIDPAHYLDPQKRASA